MKKYIIKTYPIMIKEYLSEGKWNGTQEVNASKNVLATNGTQEVRSQ